MAKSPPNQGVVVGGRQGSMATQFFRNRQMFGNFDASSEDFWTFAVGKNKSFEFYRKVIELDLSSLLVPRRP